MEALYTLALPNPEYAPMLDDIVRMVIIQFTIQFLYFINNSGNVPFFSADFFLLVVYIVLGVCVYWLLFKKLVVFK
jgi:heme/copper-type cytochrome/quinol oxidase subunit 4